MKFLHIADAHLDSPFAGLSFLSSGTYKKIHTAANKSFKKLVDFAIKKDIDLVLIAGDTFDSNHPSPKSQLFFAKQIKRLTDNQIQVVMIFGNHDYMNSDDLLIEQSLYFKLLGNNEKVEQCLFETKNGFKYVINGFSYAHNHIKEDKIPEFIPKDSEIFTFGLMHAGEKMAIGNNGYAPFTIKELRHLNYDYFALGHIHKRQILNKTPLIAYSGNIQGRHINELGQKGAYFGQIDEHNKVELEFIPTSPIVWNVIEVDVPDIISKSDLKKLLIEATNKNLMQESFICLKINQAQNLTFEESELLKDPDFWQLLSSELNYDSTIVDIRFQATKQINLNEADQAILTKAINEVFDKNNFIKATTNLAKKSSYLNKLLQDPTFQTQIRQYTQVKLSQKLKGLQDETETN